MTATGESGLTSPSDKRLRRYTLVAVFLTIFLDLVGFGMFIPILPAVARELNASNAQAAYLSTLFSIGTMLSVMVIGRLSDKVGRRKILLFTITLSLCAQLATGFALSIGSYLFLAMIRFIAGIAAGNISVAQASIADITPLRERARSMVVIGIAFGAGFALGPAIGAASTVLFPDTPLMAVAIAATALNLINLGFIAFKYKETHHSFAPQELSGIIRAASTGASTDDTVATGNIRTDLTTLVKRPYLRTIYLMQFIQIFGFVGIETILPLALADAYKFNQTEVYHSFIFIGVSALLFNAGLSRRVLKKSGETRTLAAGQICLTAGAFLIPWAAPGAAGLIAALTLLSLGSAFANPALSGLISGLSPQNKQGTALGLGQSVSAGARILGPASMGLLYDHFQGAPSLFISSALLLTVTLIGMAGLKGLVLSPAEGDNS
jgi:MFS transporter, DHA1 family, tetracycline resistance protein